MWAAGEGGGGGHGLHRVLEEDEEGEALLSYHCQKGMLFSKKKRRVERLSWSVLFSQKPDVVLGHSV